MSKKYRTSEVLELIDIPKTTLYYYLREFEDYLHIERVNNRYIFTEDDINTLLRIKSLLKEEDLSIDNVKKVLERAVSLDIRAETQNNMKLIIDKIDSLANAIKELSQTQKKILDNMNTTYNTQQKILEIIQKELPPANRREPKSSIWDRIKRWWRGER